ncbi:MAG: putative dehydrogenase [Rhodothermales bacterium]|jgi:predicted dehydrogenase
MTTPLRWGILGLGGIAHKFASDLALVDGAVLAAAASRTQAKADAFCAEHGGKAYGSYQDLLEDDQIDVVYVATPHDSHAALTIASLEHGHHVLCEKPVAVNRAQAKRMVDASSASGKFFMEALWSRFNPTIAAVIDRTQAGDIGQVRYITADFSIEVTAGPESRLLNPELAGGSLLDMGIYPLFLAYAIMGVPDRITARMIASETGVDGQTGIILEYPKAMAVLYSGFASQSNMEATVTGSLGRFSIEPMWHASDAYRHHVNRASDFERHHHPRKGLGFVHEIEECHRCIRSGETESALWSHRDSLNLIALLDGVRREIGLRYPMDSE